LIHTGQGTTEGEVSITEVVWVLKRYGLVTEEKEPAKRVRSGVEQRRYDEGGKRAKKMVCSMRAHV
jgi:hypothetical protein